MLFWIFSGTKKKREHGGRKDEDEDEDWMIMGWSVQEIELNIYQKKNEIELKPSKMTMWLKFDSG